MSHVRGSNVNKGDICDYMGHEYQTHMRNYLYPMQVIQKAKVAPHFFSLSGFNVKDIDSSPTTV